MEWDLGQKKWQITLAPRKGFRVTLQDPKTSLKNNQVASYTKLKNAKTKSREVPGYLQDKAGFRIVYVCLG